MLEKLKLELQRCFLGKDPTDDRENLDLYFLFKKKKNHNFKKRY